MAYMNQERKKSLSPAIKAVLKKYNLKGSISVVSGSGIAVTIRSGEIDFINDIAKMMVENAKPHDDMEVISSRVDRVIEDQSSDVNCYWIDTNHSGVAKDALKELHRAMMVGNHNNSDVMTDYFDVGWYSYIKIGNWNKPYILNN